MKKVVRKMLAWVVMLLFVQQMFVYAEETEGADKKAVFRINKEKAELRLDGFDAENTETQYELLFFAQAETGELWVCVNPDRNKWLGYAELEKYMDGKGAEITEADGVVQAKKLAVKVFEKKDGKTEQAVALREGRGKFSHPKYRVQVDSEKAGEKETVSGSGYDLEASSMAVEFSEVVPYEKLYIRMEEDDTLLPLEMAEELYGISGNMTDNVLTLFHIKGLFTEVPELFLCTEKNRTEGMALEKCSVEVKPVEAEQTVEGTPVVSTEEATEQVSEEPTEEATEQVSEEPTEEVTEQVSEILTEEITERVSECQTEEGKTVPERLTEKESKMWTEGETEKESEIQTEEVTEKKSETQTEEVTEKESETQAEEVTEKVSETQTEKITEEMTEAKLEVQAGTVGETAVTEKVSETESEIPSEISDDTTSLGRGKLALAAILSSAVAVLGGAVIWKRKREKKASDKKEKASEQIKQNADNDTEDTIDPMRPEIAGTRSERKGVRIQSTVINNKGRVRGNNEDSFYFNGIFMPRNRMDHGALVVKEFRDEIQLYAVCDGMGGTDSGEDASFCAVNGLAGRRQEHRKLLDANELKHTLREISDQVYEEACQRGQKSGTTIAMMLLQGQQVVFANVGDSRIYRFRNRTLTQISMDHSKVQRMISMGLLTPEQARKDPSRHVITQYLGMSPEVRVSPYIVTDQPLQKGDIYLLCSDGLTDMVEDTQIEAILQKEKKLSDAVKALFEEAMKNGGRDNTTIILVHIMGS